MKTLLLLIALSATPMTMQAQTAGDGSGRAAAKKDIGTFVTEKFASAFCEKPEVAPQPKTLANGNRQFRFLQFSVEIGPGGSILPKSKFQKDQKEMADLKNALQGGKALPGDSVDSLVIALLTDAGRYPSIGSRAIYYSGTGRGDSLQFTTADGRFDVSIEQGASACQILKFGAALNKAYEQAK